MALSSFERQTLINSWRKPSSDSEKDRQSRAERMIKGAINNHPSFSSMSYRIFAKGSYANNTNVKLDSDVDIVMECQDLFYYKYVDPQPNPPPASNSYSGIWTPLHFRQELKKALVNHFGSDAVVEGSVAFTIKELRGSRPSADVVPAFQYKYYLTSDKRNFHLGNKIFNSTGTSIVNWPEQQLTNGTKKNISSGYRYKDFVRVLKNSENYLVENGTMPALPSYFMECLIWNVPDDVLHNKSLELDFGSSLSWLWSKLANESDFKYWTEPNNLKYLFNSSQKWTLSDAKSLISNTWLLMGY